MNYKRLGALTLMLCLVAGGVATADSRWGSYAGYPKVRINMNGTTVSGSGVPAFSIDGSTVLPLRQVANQLHTIVKWDSSNETVNMYKPNVNIMVATKVDQGKTVNGVKSPFLKVDQGSTKSFDVFVQVDNLLTSVDGFKLSIVDPNGNEVDSSESSMDSSEVNFWYVWPFKVNFSERGNYTVRFAFEVDGTSYTVGEKLIVSE